MTAELETVTVVVETLVEVDTSVVAATFSVSCLHLVNEGLQRP